MLNSIPRWSLLMSLALVAAITTGCFQSVGDPAEPTVIAERLTETPTLQPTDTETPLAEQTGEVTEETEDASLLLVSATASDTATATLYIPTETPTVTNTAADVAIGQVEGTSVAQLETATPDDFQLTSTALIQQATDRVNTLTAEALGPTATFTETASPTSDPAVFVTSTPGVVIGVGDCVHEVRQGETMYRLSVNYGLPVNTIAAANGIVNPTLIIVGQRITIPGCGTTGFVPPPTSTPFVTATSQFGTGGQLGQGGGTTPIASTSTCGGQYIVQQYDTLFQISLRCNVPVQSIANANGITNINYIKMGDVLTIP